ncbi:PR-1-like protein [Dichomitus squalens]|uniref:PR-1-like protein n=1 Tax=Dichomitus squalens TaxID=114155 RepID=A0A4Q9QBF6_9APHY|nr:PR-1-like protein [Dichomitus squalens]
MNRLAYFLLSLPLLFTLLGGVQAGPACARRSQGSDSCIKACADKWGWPGYAMGTDRWGSVLTKTAPSTEALTAAVTKACRVRPSSSANSSSVAATSTEVLAQPTGVPANAQGSASVSSVISVSSVVSSSLNVSISTSTKASSTISKPAAFTASSAKPLTLSSFAAPSPSTHSTTSVEPTTTHTTPHTTSTPRTTSTPPAPEPTVVKTTSSSKAPQPTTSANSGSNSSGNGNGNSGSTSSGDGATSQSDINAYLTAHNSIRAQHGAAPLTWSDSLAAAAQTWANKCVFKHSGGTLGPFGENLAAGTGSSYDIAAAVKSWTDEVSEYDPNNPVPSHFTQVVWKGSTQVGCAVQECSGIFAASFGLAKFFVCEYSPQGNIIGEFPQNVQV